MERNRTLIGGAVLGVGLAYLLDPGRGGRRRARLRDAAVRSGHRVGAGLGATARDVRNRSTGAVARARARLRHEAVDDITLEQRIRAALGRAVSNPSAVEVRAQDGVVTLRGPVLADEIGALLAAVARVRGVHDVVDALDVHAEPGGVPGLQGVEARRARHAAPGRWSPSLRLAVGVAGGLVAYRGSRMRGPLGTVLGLAGVGLLARATANRPAARIGGIDGFGHGTHGADVQKTVTLAARLEDVWAFWSDFENFPRFMTHLKEVRRLDDTRSHWVAVGPAGTAVEWDAEITRREPQELIAWRSAPGSSIEIAGQVRFQALSNERTRIDVRLAYDPPAGRVGHAVAALFGVDPKHAMDEDLLRLKSLLEEGRTAAAGGGQITREALTTDGAE
jgi:uncharacterized membrane protein